MMDYIRNANHASADYKQTAKRCRAVHDKSQIREGKGDVPKRLFVTMTDVGDVVPELNGKIRHRHCHTRARSYGLGNTRDVV